jgi:hypothetical protein
MRELTYSTKSWHYQLADNVGYRPERDWDTGERNFGDLCSYWRHVVGGMLLIAFLMVLFTGVAWVSVNFLFGLVFSAIYGVWLVNTAGEIALFFLTVGAFLLLLFKGIPMMWMSFQRYRYNHPRPKKEDGFVKEAYKSWKEKTCVKVKFVDQE